MIREILAIIAAFTAKVADLPDFAKEEAYELVIGKRGTDRKTPF